MDKDGDKLIQSLCLGRACSQGGETEGPVPVKWTEPRETMGAISLGGGFQVVSVTWLLTTRGPSPAVKCAPEAAGALDFVPRGRRKGVFGLSGSDHHDRPRCVTQAASCCCR